MQKDTKFKLEGEIQRDKSFGSSNRVIVKRKNYKPALLFFIILSVLLLVFSTFLWFGGNQGGSSDGLVNLNNLPSQASIDSSKAPQLDSVQKEITKLQEQIQRLQEFGAVDTVGIFFEVQIGNFKDFNLDKYLEEMAHLRQEKYEGGNKFLLGRFRSFKNALLFENDLKRLGLRDVFIKGRINGKLTSKEEALELLRRN
jgi:hypothetical protein